MLWKMSVEKDIHIIFMVEHIPLSGTSSTIAFHKKQFSHRTNVQSLEKVEYFLDNLICSVCVSNVHQKLKHFHFFALYTKTFIWETLLNWKTEKQCNEKGNILIRFYTWIMFPDLLEVFSNSFLTFSLAESIWKYLSSSFVPFKIKLIISSSETGANLSIS